MLKLGVARRCAAADDQEEGVIVVDPALDDDTAETISTLVNGDAEAAMGDAETIWGDAVVVSPLLRPPLFI